MSTTSTTHYEPLASLHRDHAGVLRRLDGDLPTRVEIENHLAWKKSGMQTPPPTIGGPATSGTPQPGPQPQSHAATLAKRAAKVEGILSSFAGLLLTLGLIAAGLTAIAGVVILADGSSLGMVFFFAALIQGGAAAAVWALFSVGTVLAGDIAVRYEVTR